MSNSTVRRFGIYMTTRPSAGFEIAETAFYCAAVFVSVFSVAISILGV